ncbi:hypothetical protein MVES1_003848 [Malassezia vespertilionis]|uniref:Uncharacterized protein n=1 Tax=Malassezia vespertilionis TaxID=2020962 RepID=A0A2N1J7T6_9BASI|nr:uncharacterized protein MVES1_003848 [Malassezia vespertilionis]PKI82614.1 hypothetical protein MVES_003405 [Malassezia vespertilionis]WFD08472.1 hypothetical protein MVES1_003848 [Malassezia vespertilionis]
MQRVLFGQKDILEQASRHHVTLKHQEMQAYLTLSPVGRTLYPTAKQLLELGSYFGALPVHHGLWQSAVETRETRRLVVNPVTIKKFAQSADDSSVAALETIHQVEMIHVSAGHRRLAYLSPTHPDKPGLCTYSVTRCAPTFWAN